MPLVRFKHGTGGCLTVWCESALYNSGGSDKCVQGTLAQEAVPNLHRCSWWACNARHVAARVFTSWGSKRNVLRCIELTRRRTHLAELSGRFAPFRACCAIRDFSSVWIAPGRIMQSEWLVRRYDMHWRILQCYWRTKDQSERFIWYVTAPPPPVML